MNRISKQLLLIAREIKALDEEGNGSGFQLWHDHENAEQERLDIVQKQGKKYILHHKEKDLWRIQACKDFSDVKKGDFGGLIQKEDNKHRMIFIAMECPSPFCDGIAVMSMAGWCLVQSHTDYRKLQVCQGRGITV